MLDELDGGKIFGKAPLTQLLVNFRSKQFYRMRNKKFAQITKQTTHTKKNGLNSTKFHLSQVDWNKKINCENQNMHTKRLFIKTIRKYHIYLFHYKKFISQSPLYSHIFMYIAVHVCMKTK